jgi:hypothetical protein
MKTKIIIALSFLAINLNLALANKSFVTYLHNPVEINLNSEIANLAPVTPQEATFEDGKAVYEPANRMPDLQFIPPKEAYFTDIVPEPLTDISIFAPSAPKEATFDDELNCGTVFCNDTLKSLAPAAPKEADFKNSSMNNGNDMENFSHEPNKESGD